MNVEQVNDYKGYSLFNDIEDEGLRRRNRAVVMTNISEENSKNGLITPMGFGLIIGYFDKVPNVERASLQTEYVKHMNQRGFKIVH